MAFVMCKNYRTLRSLLLSFYPSASCILTSFLTLSYPSLQLSLFLYFSLGFPVTLVWWTDPKVSLSDSCLLVFTPLCDPLEFKWDL